MLLLSVVVLLIAVGVSLLLYDGRNVVVTAALVPRTAIELLLLLSSCYYVTESDRRTLTSVVRETVRVVRKKKIISIDKNIKNKQTYS